MPNVDDKTFKQVRIIQPPASNLKPSLSARRPYPPHHGHYSNDGNDEDEQHSD
jgi:hypothetical protein